MKNLFSDSRTWFAAIAAAAAVLVPAQGAKADNGAVIVAHLDKNASKKAAIQLEAPPLLKLGAAECGKLPGVGIPNPTPFPFAIHLGGTVSPTTKLAAGVDLTLPEFHIVPTLSTRIDGDVIFGANLGGSNTIIPVTVDQIYSKAMPGSTSFYLGGGVGMYFGGKTRFGGKIVLGANENKMGVEGDILFAGIGNPIYMIVARIGL